MAVIKAVVQTGSRTFRSTSGTTLTVPLASAPHARLAIAVGSAIAPRVAAAPFINFRRNMPPLGIAPWCRRISATL